MEFPNLRCKGRDHKLKNELNYCPILQVLGEYDGQASRCHRVLPGIWRFSKNIRESPRSRNSSSGEGENDGRYNYIFVWYYENTEKKQIQHMPLKLPWGELGDYEPKIHEGNYISEHKLLLKQTEVIEEKAMKLHQTELKGFTPEQAETHFLRLASQLDTYAVDPHPVKTLLRKCTDIMPEYRGVSLGELGDYEPKIHEGNYISEHKLLLKQTEVIEEKAMKLHQTELKGFTPEQAETHFLRLASQLDTYAVDPHPVKVSFGNTFILLIHFLLTLRGRCLCTVRILLTSNIV
ncbi:FERM domain-containing protein 3 [Eufriesea mexicana]|uniref:FERM domain-containing protein 3 n=1 Tax=Eufriesea mexicana TaxID=516756 RepID=A0A310SVG0_9HYME|nr:FERM domain-containing protein 3 [Eufriesea mexicana]